MVQEHSSKQYDLDLEMLRTRVLEMGGLVEAQIGAAIKGLTANLSLIHISEPTRPY